MSRKLMIPHLRSLKENLDEVAKLLADEITKVRSGEKLNQEVIQLANATSKQLHAAVAAVDCAREMHLAAPELALIIEDQKPRKLTASDKEWNAAGRGTDTKKVRSRRNAVAQQ